MIFEYCRWRLSLDPVALDFPGQKPVLDDVLRGSIGATPQDPEAVFGVDRDTLAGGHPGYSPRFLAFIPAVLDQGLAAVRHGGVGVLAAGQLLARGGRSRGRGEPDPPGAGRPGRAPGERRWVLRLGGSSANLWPSSWPARWGAGGSVTAPRRGCACGERPGPLLGRQGPHGAREDAVVVPCPDYRLTGPALATVLDADPDPGKRHRGRGHRRHHERRHRRRPEQHRQVVVRPARLWSHVDGDGGLAAVAPVRHCRGFAASSMPTRSSWTATSWLFVPFDCAALIYRDPHLARAVHTQDARLSRCDPHGCPRRVEPERCTPST